MIFLRGSNGRVYQSDGLYNTYSLKITQIYLIYLNLIILTISTSISNKKQNTKKYIDSVLSSLLTNTRKGVRIELLGSLCNS
jgi:hypothetical protein